MTIGPDDVTGIFAKEFSFGQDPHKTLELLYQCVEEGLVTKPAQAKAIKGIVFDFGALYPGDHQSEALIAALKKQHSSFLRDLYRELKSLNLKVIVSMTPGVNEQEVRALFLEEPELIYEKRPFSLSYLYFWSQQDLLVLGANQILSAAKVLCQSSSTIKPPFVLVSLWGAIEKVGAHWLATKHSMAEVYELTGGGGDRLSFVLIDGPRGCLYSWQEVKSKSLGELATQARTIHFLSSKEVNNFVSLWNEMFSEDSCHRCLPCSLIRKAMGPSAFSSLFLAKAPYLCAFPSLYRQGESLYHSMKEGDLSV